MHKLDGEKAEAYKITLLISDGYWKKQRGFILFLFLIVYIITKHGSTGSLYLRTERFLQQLDKNS